MIVFNRDQRGNVDLYLRTARGKIVRLTRWKGLDEYASFSADGKRIAFGRKRAKRKANLRLLRSESEEFAASVERDLSRLPTIEERDSRRR